MELSAELHQITEKAWAALEQPLHALEQDVRRRYPSVGSWICRPTPEAIPLFGELGFDLDDPGDPEIGTLVIISLYSEAQGTEVVLRSEIVTLEPPMKNLEGPGARLALTLPEAELDQMVSQWSEDTLGFLKEEAHLIEETVSRWVLSQRDVRLY